MENKITDSYEITGRGTVLLCENCTYNLGDTFFHNGAKYKIKGIEMQGKKEKPYKNVGLLVSMFGELDEKSKKALHEIEKSDRIKEFVEDYFKEEKQRLEEALVLKFGVILHEKSTIEELILGKPGVAGMLLKKYNKHFGITSSREGNL